MSRSTSIISLDVQLANPGQFLACCGLLELASRVDNGALAWFDRSEPSMPITRFSIRCADVAKLLHDIKEASFEGAQQGEVKQQRDKSAAEAADAQQGEESQQQRNKSAAEEKSPPIFVRPFELLLDWWNDDWASKGKLKTWSGGQNVKGFLTGMHKKLSHLVESEILQDLLQRVEGVDKPKPFYFDARLSRLTGIDLGFSSDGTRTAFSPAVEFFAFVGLQRFRVRTIRLGERYGYSIWSSPLPVSVASAVTAGCVREMGVESYSFPLITRSGKKYKAFGVACREQANEQ